MCESKDRRITEEKFFRHTFMHYYYTFFGLFDFHQLLTCCNLVFIPMSNLQPAKKDSVSIRRKGRDSRMRQLKHSQMDTS